jgi:hypothetical protein
MGHANRGQASDQASAVGQAGAGDPGTGQNKGTPTRGQIRSESPVIAGTDPDGSPPKTAGNDTHRAVEGLGIAWPGADLAIIALAAWYVLAAAAYIGRLRRHARQLTPQDKLVPQEAR